MANQDEAHLNKLLVNLFNSVMIAESKAVLSEDFCDITENDMHIIEAIGINEPKMTSEIARSLNVTAGTLTVNMNSLEKKGYIIRTRSEEDKRVVRISLTEQGTRVYHHHKNFHKKMIKSAIAGLTTEERKLLLACLTKLDIFFSEF